MPLGKREDVVRRGEEVKGPSSAPRDATQGLCRVKGAAHESPAHGRAGRNGPKGVCSARAARAMLAIPLALSLTVGCSSPVAYALEHEDGDSLRASAFSAQGVNLEAADADRSSLHELYLPVLFSAASGLGEFAENYRACDPELWEPEYFLFDLGADGVPELMVRTSAFNGVSIVHVFSAASGKVVSLGSYWEWFGGSAGNEDGELYAAGWNQGSSYVNAVSLEGGKVVSRFLKSGKTTVDAPTGEMQVVNDFLAKHDASWVDASPVSDSSLLERQARYSLSKGTITMSSSAVYTGRAQAPRVTVKFGKTTLKEGVDYTVSYKDNVNAGMATAMVTGLGDYQGTLSVCFTIAKADISKATVTLAKAGAYTGLAKTPVATVRNASGTLKAGVDFSVAYGSNKNAGVATAVVTGKGNYQGSKTVKFTIAKAKNPMKLKVTDKSLTAKSLAKKSHTFKAIQFQEKARGKVSYTNASSATVQKAVSVDRSTGALTVKRGTKARVYTVKVRVAAAGDSNYLAASKTMPIKVKVI